MGSDRAAAERVERARPQSANTVRRGGRSGSGGHGLRPEGPGPRTGGNGEVGPQRTELSAAGDGGRDSGGRAGRRQTCQAFGGPGGTRRGNEKAEFVEENEKSWVFVFWYF